MRRILIILLLALAAAACRPGEPLRASGVQIGRSLNSDNSVGAITTVFKPDDTIYVAVLTDEPGTSTITARWYYSGTLVNETAKEASYFDPSATEFHLLNSSGFPAGQYRVDILIDGEQVATRQFRVEG